MRLVALASLVSLVGCRSPGTPTVPPAPPPPDHAASPRLVVLLVIDQWPQWAFVQKRPALTGGFDRLLREGEWHTGQHPSAATLTAPGHALLGSGEPTATSGIVANEWWHRDVERVLPAVEDLDGTTSARWLRVPGLGDAVAAANTGAKAVAVSLKDRAAILPLGHAGTAIWYDQAAVAFTSPARPAWLAAYARAHPIAARLRDVWTPLDPARLAALSATTDDQAGEVGERGFGATFPHALAATKDPAGAVVATPLGNQLVLELAVAAIDGERLGADAAADLLVISLSAHDLVGHGWGHESWEAWDLTLRLDRQLDRLLAALDAKLGANRWAMIVTSDHGASPLPERFGQAAPHGSKRGPAAGAARSRRDGGRITFESIMDAANRAAIAELGPGNWIASARYPTVYLTAAARARPPRELAKAVTKIVYALRSFPGIARPDRTAGLAGRCETRTGEDRAICLALDVERSGDVVYLPAPGWILEHEHEPIATAHGSLHPYDREVPLIVLPPGRTTHAALAAPSATIIPMARVSAMLARWLGVTPPASMPRGGP